jgi:pyrimidine deaminase RibD-like protein
MNDLQNTFMRQALQEAMTAARLGEVPVGALIVSPEGQPLASCYNQSILLKDPTAHAELLAIRQACQKIGYERLIGCSLYVTLEPCAMCAAAISFARLKTLYYGASDSKSGGIDHGAKVYSHRTCHHKPEVLSGILKDECGKILQDFFKDLRKKRQDL